MISKTIGYNGVHYLQTNPNGKKKTWGFYRRFFLGCDNFRGGFMGFCFNWVFVWMSMGLCKIYALDLMFFDV